jgi:hypothetical protein
MKGSLTRLLTEAYPDENWELKTSHMSKTQVAVYRGMKKLFPNEPIEVINIHVIF